MSSQSSKEQKSPVRSSSETRHIDLYLFACGHGDTLLIRLPDEQWVLIDCHLPKRGGVRQRFFDFLEKKSVKRLAFVCQTHPDYDHFLGMHDVLTHFIEGDGTSVGMYVDSGLDASQIKWLLEEPRRPGRSEYQKLQRSLREWHRDGKIDCCELDAKRHPLSPKGFSKRIEFIPIAPDPIVKRRITETSLEKYGKNPNSKLEANKLSLVLGLTVNDGKAKFNVLLAADASIEAIAHAMALWQQHASERGISDRFNVIKVAHHGSVRSHYPELCRLGPDDASSKVAAISTGGRDALPDRHVLEGYLKSDWTVMATTVGLVEQAIHFRRNRCMNTCILPN